MLFAMTLTRSCTRAEYVSSVNVADTPRTYLRRIITVFAAGSGSPMIHLRCSLEYPSLCLLGFCSYTQRLVSACLWLLCFGSVRFGPGQGPFACSVHHRWGLWSPCAVYNNMPAIAMCGFLLD